jgi:hypothetical protein
MPFTNDRTYSSVASVQTSAISRRGSASRTRTNSERVVGAFPRSTRTLFRKSWRPPSCWNSSRTGASGLVGRPREGRCGIGLRFQPLPDLRSREGKLAEDLGSGRNRIVVPEPRTCRPESLSAEVAFPLRVRLLHSAPSRRTVAVISDERAQTTDAPTP